MKIDELKILAEVFQEPNLTKIAQRFHMSQSSLSKIIKKIEQDLGFLLFERKGFQGLKPTPQGLIFSERIQRFTRSWDDTISLVKSFDDRKIDLKITGPGLYMRHIFLPRWFSSDLPDRYRLIYVQSRIDQISLLAQSGDLDIVITPTPAELIDWVPTQIFTEKFAIFSSLRSEKAPTEIDLKSRSWVAYRASNDIIQHFFHEHQIQPEKIIAFIDDVESILDILEDQPNLLSILPEHAGSSHRRLKSFALPASQGQSLHLTYRVGQASLQEAVKKMKLLLKAT